MTGDEFEDWRQTAAAQAGRVTAPIDSVSQSTDNTAAQRAKRSVTGQK